MSIFDQREHEFETRFALEEEQRFKTLVRRNRLFGGWVARELGLENGAAEEYVQSLVDVLLKPNGERETIKKVVADLRTGGSQLTPAQVKAELRKMAAQTSEEIKRS